MRREIVETLKERYPNLTRVELVEMDDIQAPPAGTRGTVRGVDDMGNILITWDNGSSLSAVYGVDQVRIVSE